MKCKALIHFTALMCCSTASHAAEFGVVHYWHDSHVGSSTPQNLMSVAAVVAASICICAAAAAASSALDERIDPLASLPEETEFMRPAVTVDFSACVADMVRR